MKYLIQLLFLASLVLLYPERAHAASDRSELNCLMTFYQTKDSACLDKVAETRKAFSNPSIVGFFSGVFSAHPQEKERLLSKDVPTETGILFIIALHLSDLEKEMRSYIAAKDLGRAAKAIKMEKLVPLKNIKPTVLASDNDILIGAYAASGNTAYITRILENFSSADDEMVAYALRLSLMMGKFGPDFIAQGRETKMMQTACEKFACKKDMQKFMRVMTLSSAFWAMQSLSRKDEGVKKVFTDFFKNNSRLNKHLVLEQNAFGNYLTLLAAYIAIKDNATINEALSAYEKFSMDQDTIAGIKKSKGKK